MIEIYFESKPTVKFTPKTWLFPGGEVGFNIENCGYLAKENGAVVVARIASSNDFMEMVMCVNALRCIRPIIKIALLLPYFPYARQDRVCAPGDAFALKAVASLVNSLEVDAVHVIDPHSSVLAGCLDSLTVTTQLEVLSKFPALHDWVFENKARIVSPDAGAEKKATEAAKYFAWPEIVRCYKVRNPSTGEIEGVEVFGDIQGRHLLIVDDICDGGRTFIEIALALKAKGARSIALYVTHGIFSKGTDVLYNAGIDEIFTTNSFHAVYPAGISAKVNTLDINNLAL